MGSTQGARARRRGSKCSRMCASRGAVAQGRKIVGTREQREWRGVRRGGRSTPWVQGRYGVRDARGGTAPFSKVAVFAAPACHGFGGLTQPPEVVGWTRQADS